MIENDIYVYVALKVLCLKESVLFKRGKTSFHNLCAKHILNTISHLAFFMVSKKNIF